MIDVKVGDKFRRISEDSSYFTRGHEYKIRSLKRDGVRVTDDGYEDHSLSYEYLAEHFTPVNESTTQSDAVHSPAHYTQGAVEVIDYIDQVAESYVGKDAAYVANVIKYVSRAPHKNGVEDVKKAIWYAERLAESMASREAKE